MVSSTTSLIERQKERQDTHGTHSLEPQKAHPTGEFVIVAQNGDCALVRLASSHATMVKQPDKNLSLIDFFKVI